MDAEVLWIRKHHHTHDVMRGERLALYIRMVTWEGCNDFGCQSHSWLVVGEAAASPGD